MRKSTTIFIGGDFLLGICCDNEKNHAVEWVWAGVSKDDEGGYEPLYIYCEVCREMVKFIGVGGYWSMFSMLSH